MAQMPSSITVELKMGPVFKCFVETYALVEKALELVPEWNVAERKSLEQELERLRQQVKHLSAQ